MIAIILTVLTPLGPLAQMRSTQVFDSLAACEVARAAEADRHARLQADLARELGVPVVVATRCADLREVAA